MLVVDWIRHTSLEIDGKYCYGQTDVSLAKSFEEEAAIVKSRIEHTVYDQVFTSPLSRAAKLATYCGYANAVQDPRVMELYFGEWELKKWEDLIMYENMDDWFGNWHTITPPGGENLFDLFARLRSFIDDLRMSHYQRVAVFCHGGVINSARYFNQEVEIQHIYRHVPPYGSVHTISYPFIDQQSINR